MIDLDVRVWQHCMGIKYGFDIHSDASYDEREYK